jgi:tetratricopeptide (TPR) repeat protein
VEPGRTISLHYLVSDPLRSDPIDGPEHRSDGDPERSAKIESLLLTGLDHYFSSDYAQAIDVWTRALFLDRGHARARAYIERARSALAERQRESEEMLHSGVAAFERGEMDAARQLLNAAVQRGGAHEVALAFLTRIDRINAAAPLAATSTSTPARTPIPPAAIPARRAWSRLLKAVFALAVAATIAYALTSWDEVSRLLPGFDAASEMGLAPKTPALEPLVVPLGSESAMDRARALFASGRLHDALRAIDLIRPVDPLRGDADRLKALIQRELIAHQTTPGVPPPR